MSQNTDPLKISAVIITYNEEACIDRCLSSLNDIADEIIVVDSFSTDKTEEICKKHNVRFFQNPFAGYRDQKNYALNLASNSHIIALDADEALSEELRKSVLEVKKNWKYEGYYFRRRNFFCGRWIKHSTWYPDKQLRLFISGKGKFGELNFHEKFIMSNGQKIETLDGDLYHWTASSREEFVEKMEKYAVVGAKEYHKAGRKANFFTPYVHYIWGFFRAYFISRGFLDGIDGYLICSTYARSSFLKYKNLRKFNKNGSTQDH